MNVNAGEALTFSEEKLKKDEVGCLARTLQKNKDHTPLRTQCRIQKHMTSYRSIAAHTAEIDTQAVAVGCARRIHISAVEHSSKHSAPPAQRAAQSGN